MKFLVDANLPPALAQWLVSEGHEARHVADLGMQAAADREIWQHARDSGACIVTKDEDSCCYKHWTAPAPPLSGFVSVTRFAMF